MPYALQSIICILDIISISHHHGTQCEEKSHRTAGSFPQTSTAALHQLPTHNQRAPSILHTQRENGLHTLNSHTDRYLYIYIAALTHNAYIISQTFVCVWLNLFLMVLKKFDANINCLQMKFTFTKLKHSLKKYFLESRCSEYMWTPSILFKKHSECTSWSCLSGMQMKKKLKWLI